MFGTAAFIVVEVDALDASRTHASLAAAALETTAPLHRGPFLQGAAARGRAGRGAVAQGGCARRRTGGQLGVVQQRGAASAGVEVLFEAAAQAVVVMAAKRLRERRRVCGVRGGGCKVAAVHVQVRAGAVPPAQVGWVAGRGDAIVGLRGRDGAVGCHCGLQLSRGCGSRGWIIAGLQWQQWQQSRRASGMTCRRACIVQKEIDGRAPEAVQSRRRRATGLRSEISCADRWV